MQERAVETHPVVDHQQVPFEREGCLSREDYHAVRRCDVRCAGGAGHVDAGMVAPRLSAIDALRTELARDASLCRPDEILAPTSAARLKLARGPNPLQLRTAAREKLGTRHVGGRRSIDLLDVPGARRNRERAIDPTTVAQQGRKDGLRARVAVECREELTSVIERERLITEPR